jgi:iron complex transport system substrate-binding protein
MASSLRIASLLPSATEIVGRLGLASHVVGVSHECDLCPDKATLSTILANRQAVRLTSSTLHPETVDQQTIDTAVKSSLASKASLYGIATPLLAAANPTVIFSQSLCHVCAPSSDQLTQACATLPNSTASVVNLEPHTLADVLLTFESVANACAVPSRGQILRNACLEGFQQLDELVRTTTEGHPPPVAYVLEWLSPPFDAGHWVPECLAIAQGRLDATSLYSPAPLQPTKDSTQISWAAVIEAQPDVLFVSCCGFDLDRNVKDATLYLNQQPELNSIPAVSRQQVWALDGNRYLARPGPSLLEATAVLAYCLWQHVPECLQALRASGLLPADITQVCQQVPLPPVTQASSELPSTPSLPSQLGSVHEMAGLPEPEDIESPSWLTLHQDACARGDKFYTDPTSGLLVMTELVHRDRGRCCGSGCRHCLYAHDNVPVRRRSEKISQPAWLLPPSCVEEDDDDDDDADAPQQALVLFWSTGKDSYLALRALRRTYPLGGPVQLVLLTTFDADSRHIAHQEVEVQQAVAQAQALELPLFGVPLQRGGLPYAHAIGQSLTTIRASFPEGKGANCEVGR